VQQSVRESSSRDRAPHQAVKPAAVLLFALTVILTIQASRVGTFSGDLHFTAWIQAMSAPGVDRFVSFLNWLGRPIPLFGLTLVLSAVLVAFRRYMETALLLSSGFVHAANALLKTATASPRPTGDVVRVSDQASGFGFPSGHTMALVVFCGICFYLAWRLTGRLELRLAAGITALLLILGMGFSRIHTGAHWPTDVLGAYLWGTFYVLALIAVYRRVNSTLRGSTAGAT
jgi:undecaprenyl-diphosphatase